MKTTKSRMVLMIGLASVIVHLVRFCDQAIAASQPLSKEERIRGLLTIHAAARQHFAWFDRLPHLDWDRAFVEYLSRIELEQSLYEYYRVLQRFIALLEDGHTSVRLPAEVQKSLDLLPVRLEFIQDRWIVVQRYPVPEILHEDVAVGSVLMSIEGLPARMFFREQVYPYIPAGSEDLRRSSVNWAATFPRNAKVTVELRYPDGTVRRRLLAANRSRVTWSDDLRRKFTPAEAQPPFSFRHAPGDILLARYGRCDSASEEQFSKLIASRQDRWPRALILDLRDNPGGDTPHRLLGHLLAQPTKIWQRRTRCSISELDAQLQMTKKSGASATGVSEAIQRAIERGDLPKGYSPGWMLSAGVLQPEPIHYDGPLYVLVNGETGSAAEDVAAILQGCGRATLVGTVTAGSTGNTVHFDLPGGGEVRICAVQVKYPDGRDFVPTGVRPDVPVARTIDGIVQGRDEALEAALDRVQQNLRTRGAGK